MAGIRADILWEENTRGLDPIKGGYEGIIVFCSRPAQNAPVLSCRTRTEMPQIGQLESCILFKHQTKESYIAYPATDDYSCIQMPGSVEPVLLQWNANEQIEGDVIASVTLSDSYYRVFVHRDWPGKKPALGEAVLCKIRWIRHFPSNQILGHATPADQDPGDNIETIVAHNAVWIGETGVILVTTTTNYQAAAKSGQDGKIIIELTPDN